MTRFLLISGVFLLTLAAFGEDLCAQSTGGPVSCEKCLKIPDYESIFDPASFRQLTEGVTEEKLIEAFCASWQAIDEKLTTIAVLQKNPQQENFQQENLQQGPSLGEIPQHEISVKEIEKLEAEIHVLYHQMMDWIGPVWQLAPQKNEVKRFMFFLLARALEEDQYESAYLLAGELMAKKAYEENPVLYEMAGISAFMMGKFEVARYCFMQAQNRNVLSGTAGVYLDLIPYYTQAWKTEQALRSLESQKGTAPRVLIETTRGEVEIELFEDSAPQTVRAFLKLVGEGFYDGDSFSTVLSGLFARTDRVAPGVEIPDEFTLPSARKHFRGSVVLMHGGGKDSGHSQFFIMLAPAPQLDGKYTVFGRVTRGIDVVSALNRVNARQPEKNQPGVRPDQILSVKILNP